MRDPTDRRTSATDANAVARFVDRLAAFRPGDWLGVASAVERDASAHGAASAALAGLIARQGFGVDAWSALDDLETVAQANLAEAWPFGRSRLEAARIRVARRAADAAALALLLRAQLGPDAFETLYAPFAESGPRVLRPTVAREWPEPNVAETPPEVPGAPITGEPRRRRLAVWRKLVFRVLARVDAHRSTPYGIPPERVEYVDVPVDL